MFENILVADDSMLARKMMSASIQAVIPEAKIDMAKDGADAVARMIDTPAEVVFVDYNMPEMNGLEAITKMAEHFPTAHYVLVTANTQKALAARLDQMNATIIQKPINPDKIREFLTSLGDK